MNTIRDLIDAFGGNTKFAGIIGMNVSAVSEMKRRSSVPVEYWPALIRQAPKFGVVGLTADRLLELQLGKAKTE